MYEVNNNFGMAYFQTTMIDSMNDKQLKEYLENRPEELKITKIPKTNPHHNLKHKVWFLFKKYIYIINNYNLHLVLLKNIN